MKQKCWLGKFLLKSRKYNFEYYFASDKNGMRGGLTLFWSLEVNVEIKS